MKVTRENKQEFGMNRNDFYEYKKNRALEMVHNGAKAEDIAEDLGMGDKEIYAFLSRNFGGIRRMREMDVSRGVTRVTRAAMSIEESSKKKKGNKSSKIPSSVSDCMDIEHTLEVEKERLTSAFRASVHREMDEILKDMQVEFSNLKHNLLDSFKSDLVAEISRIGSHS